MTELSALSALPAGLEPTTKSLTVTHSTIELRENMPRLPFPTFKGVRKNSRTARVTRLRFLPQIPKGSNLQPPVLETGALPIELGTYVPQRTFRRELGAQQ